MPAVGLRSIGIPEQWYNRTIGISVCSWAILGMIATGDDSLVAPVRWGIAALHLTVGCLFLFRRPAKANGSVAEILQALPALFIAGFALRLSPPPAAWHWLAQVVFLSGVVLAVSSLACLGKCFSVLPANRGVVSRGPYRLVRHPIYLGEVIMLLGCAIAAANWQSYALLVLAIAFVLIRARAEEKLLEIDPAYCLYRQQTPDMLIPGVAYLLHSFAFDKKQSNREQ